MCKKMKLEAMSFQDIQKSARMNYYQMVLLKAQKLVQQWGAWLAY
jgi:hypothetical protein